MRDRYDVVIVGGGSAGCVLANRLSADPSTSVCVLEAGRPDRRWDVFIHMPAAFSVPLGNRWYDWRYESEPEPHLAGRRIAHARGKVLGGSSSINGMIFQRGNPLDYDRWAREPGMGDWDHAHCLPYFRRMETCLAPDDGPPWRGDDGPLILERGPATNPLFVALLAAAEQAGYRLTSDVNGACQEGFAAFDRTIHRGRRLSAARAYLHPVRHRRNLEVYTRAFTRRIVFRGRRAVGVEVRHRGRTRVVEAGEVICCAGAINTPQLLQVSGVGPADHLRRVGVEVVADVPGVGANLQDHLEVYIQHACRRPVSMQPYLARRRWPEVGLRWLFRRGPGATNHFEAGGFVRSDDRVDRPDLMFHFLPLAVRYDGTRAPVAHGYQVHVGPMFSAARGTVLIRSADPTVKPALRFAYLSTERDRVEWLAAVRIAREILSQPALADFDGGEISPGPSVVGDDEVLAWVAREAETALHPSGTAKMGIGDDAVVDPSTMRVHGLDGVRVVDASVMPHITNANIYAPTMMIAERAADLIAGATPLAPEYVPTGPDARRGAPGGADGAACDDGAGSLAGS
ncbi:MAG: choline dehydrogenase [Actinomyces sp.]|nr:MAG: choline dehydrogenase [Actinomyces sp.]